MIHKPTVLSISLGTHFVKITYIDLSYFVLSEMFQNKPVVGDVNQTVFS